MERPVGAALDRELRFAKAMATDIDNLIARHHNRRVREEGRDRPEEMAWKESTRKHAERQRQQARLEWHAHHAGQAQRLRHTLQALIDYHEQQAEELASFATGDDAA